MRYLKTLIRRSLDTFFELVKIMLPIALLVRIGEHFGLSESLGWLLGPVMDLVGLPPETGIVWAVTLLTGIYGGIGAYLMLLPHLDLTLAQHSILCAMMLFAHALPLEQAIVRRAGVSFLATALIRIGAAFLYGGLIAWLCSATGSLSGPVETAWASGAPGDADWVSWSLSTLGSLSSLLGIIFLLFALLDIVNALGVTRWITKALTPLLRAVGIDPRLAPMTTIGLLLGLSYGGGLIIEATRCESYDKRALFLSLTCLSLCHSLIEDTAMMLAIGADFWVVLPGRLAFTATVMIGLAWFLRRAPQRRLSG